MNQTYVLDSGAAYFRLGLAGEDVPASVVPSIYGTTLSPEGAGQKASTPKPPTASLVVGEPDIELLADTIKVHSLYGEDGKVRNWSAMESLLRYSRKAWDSSLDTDTLAHPVLVAENVGHEARAHFAELLFEKCQAPKVFFAKAPTLACYASARTKGVVLDLGHFRSRACVVQDSYVLKESFKESTVASEALTSLANDLITKRLDTKILLPFEFQRKLDDKGLPVMRKLDVKVHDTYRTYVTRKIMRAAVQEVCQVPKMPVKTSPIRKSPAAKIKATNTNTTAPKPPVPAAESTANASSVAPAGGATPAAGSEPVAMETEERGPVYTLPDGTEIEESMIKHAVPEVLFKSSSFPKRDDLPLHQLVLAATSTLKNGDMRKDMLNNVVVCGGLSALPGLVDRLSEELNFAAKAAKPRVLVAGFDKRIVLPWIGGSILGSLSGFEDLCVSRQEYEETGASVFGKKCP